MRDLESTQRLDLDLDDANANPEYALSNVIRPGYGNMFGVMECEGAKGETVVLRAFSSLQYGIRRIEGWVLPLLDAVVYEGTILPAQDEIKSLTARMEATVKGSAEYQETHNARRDVSRGLWDQMCATYRFRNFRGEERSLAEAILPGTPITGGMGECCAPKLLNHAVIHGLTPISLAEFYWGDSSQSGPRVPGEFYESCAARCQPILGFLLCGLDDA